MRGLYKTLESLGPVFIYFGLYMSTRIDLLSAQNCLALASLPRRAEPTANSAVQRLIKQELGHSPEGLFRVFEETPFATGLLHQQHQAWLPDQQAVTVSLARPEIEEHLHYDLQLLDLVTGAFLGAGCSSAQIDGAIEDFAISLQQQRDFASQAGAIATLAKDSELFGMLRVPFVYRELSTSRILVTEALPGRTAEEMLRVNPQALGAATVTLGDEERYEVAHRLCVAWLRQALLGSRFPVEPSAENIKILPDNKIAFCDGPLASLPVDAKTNLWDYLIAVATENPDRACSSLLKEMVKGKRSISEDELQRRFRQLVPFRDSEWAFGSENDNLADHLFLHWRLTCRSDYRPRAHLPAFYRGLFALATVSQQLASHRDALRDAFQNIRILAGAERLRQIFSTPQLGEQMDAYLGIMLDLPQRFDEALAVGADGKARLSLQKKASPQPRRKKNSVAVDIALLFALGALVMFPDRLEAVVSGKRSFMIGVVAFVCFGAWLLGSARHGR
jgi:predicted unusual protein kinase regulating ubiquinone biosynthesis (AarF/ABC1/UbiB family)